MQETGLLPNSKEKFSSSPMPTCCLMLTGFLSMPMRYRDFQPLSSSVVGFFRIGLISRRDGLEQNVSRYFRAFWSGMTTAPKRALTRARRNHHSARALLFGEL